MSATRVERVRRRTRRHNRIHGHVIEYQKPDALILDEYREIGYREGGYVDIEAKVIFQPSERMRKAVGLHMDASIAIEIDRHAFEEKIKNVDEIKDRLWIRPKSDSDRSESQEFAIVSTHLNAGAYGRGKVILGARRVL